MIINKKWMICIMETMILIIKINNCINKIEININKNGPSLCTIYWISKFFFS